MENPPFMSSWFKETNDQDHISPTGTIYIIYTGPISQVENSYLQNIISAALLILPYCIVSVWFKNLIEAYFLE